MKTNPLKDSLLTEHASIPGIVTRKMVRERAAELAVINGRPATQASKADWDQAKRELTGQPDADPKEVVLEAAPESERWNPVPGSIGHKVPAVSSEVEDAEDRSDGEKLIAAGVAEAEHDQMLRATRDVNKKDS